MASSIKVGMAAFVVLAVVAGFAGTSAAGVTCFVSCSIQIDDLTDTPTVQVFRNNQSGPPTNITSILQPVIVGETITFTISDLQNATPGTRYVDLLEDRAVVSDRVLVSVAPPTSSGFSAVTITFTSDSEATFPPPPPLVMQVGTLLENGDFQEIPNLGLGPMISSFQVRSDAPESVPEPSTLLLLGGPLAGLLGMTWRRRRQRESRA